MNWLLLKQQIVRIPTQQAETRNPGVEHPSQWDFSSSHCQEGPSLASNSQFSAIPSPLSCKHWRENHGQIIHSKEMEISHELGGKEWHFLVLIFFETAKCTFHFCLTA